MSDANPIGSFERVIEQFLVYLDTAFATSWREVNDERNAFLSSTTELFQPPLIEPIPLHRPSGITVPSLGSRLSIGTAAARANVQRIFIEAMERGLLFDLAIGGHDIYQHQWEMIDSAINGPENHCIITSGTGSGKTEAFLMPILAHIFTELEEANRLGTPFARHSNCDDWWSNSAWKTAQRALTPPQSVHLCPDEGDQRTPGLRAIIIYPMNALVEDQMRRLRMALDNEQMHDLYQTEFGGRRPRFARYNSATIGGTKEKGDQRGEDKVISDPKSGGITQMEDEFKETEFGLRGSATPRGVPAFFDLRVPDEKKGGFFAQNPYGCEQRCRWDIHESPPDILVTNFSMLQTLIMRQMDDPIFTQTKTYLNQPDAKFFLVIDELHLYRGTAGTENAYLLRLLLKRLELLPTQTNHPKLRILASSASLDPASSTDFLQDFFGIDPPVAPLTRDYKIITGKHADIGGVDPLSAALPSPVTLPISYQEFIDLADIQTEIDTTSLSASEATVIDNLATSLGVAPGPLPMGRLSDSLSSSNLNFNQLILHLCQEPVGAGYELRPRTMERIASTVFNLNLPLPTATDNIIDSDAWKAVKGLLRARGLVDLIPNNEPLLSMRIHSLLRNVKGMAALPDVATTPAAYIPATVPRLIGKIVPMGSGVQTDPVSGITNRALETLYCDRCGTTMFGGIRGITQKVGRPGAVARFALMDNDIDPNKSIPERVDERSYRDYAVFWPSSNSIHPDLISRVGGSNYEPVQHPFSYEPASPVPFPNRGPRGRRVWARAYLNPVSGEVTVDIRPPAGPTTIEGWTMRISYIQIFDIATGQYDRFNGAGGVQVSVDERNDDHLKELGKIRALPHDCPCCGEDFTARFNTGVKFGRLNPIRSFGTGFSEVSQLMVRGITDLMPTNDRKLMAFSDSRDGAARLAFTVEGRQRDELIYELAYRRLKDIAVIEPEIASAISASPPVPIPAGGPTEMQDRYNKAVPNLYYHQNIDISNEWSAVPAGNRLLIAAINRGVPGNPAYRVAKLEWILTPNTRGIFPTMTVSQTSSLSPLFLDLLKRGNNPGGLNDTATFPGPGSFPRPPWLDSIDTRANPPSIRSGSTNQVDTLDVFLKGDLMNAMMAGRSTLESAALGSFCIDVPAGSPPTGCQSLIDMASALGITGPQLIQVANGMLRILGRRYRYRKQGRADFSTTIKDKYGMEYLRKIATTYGVSNGSFPTAADHLAEVLFNRTIGTAASLAGSLLRDLSEAFDNDLYIKPQKISVRIAESGDVTIICPSCNEVHLESSVDLILICTRCYSDMSSGSRQTAQWHWSRDQKGSRLNIPSYQRPSLRLHTEELTGQTDNPARNQRLFRGIFGPNDNEDIDEINALCVTTTTEVGVDMGSLSSIYLANMPPQRFNYQQRVGRAGRRNQSFAYAWTMCRDLSHDAHYYKYPEKITGDPCPPPVLITQKKTIAKRLFAKECLREAFKTQRASITHRHPVDKNTDTHGEFGLMVNNDDKKGVVVIIQRMISTLYLLSLHVVLVCLAR